MPVLTISGSALVNGGKYMNLPKELVWDANGATAGLTDGAGAWLTANLWRNIATNLNQSWENLATAIFGNGGAGGIVTLGGYITVYGIIFRTFTGTYTIGSLANRITLRGGVKQQAGGIVVIDSPIWLDGPCEFCNDAAGNVTFNRGIDNQGNDLTFDVASTGTIKMNGNTGGGQIAPISGSGGVNKYGSGAVDLGGGGTPPTHTYTGPTRIYGGTIMFLNNIPAATNILLQGGQLEWYWSGTNTFPLGAGAGQVQVMSGRSGFSAQGSAWTITLGVGTLVWGSTYFQPTVLGMNAASSNGTTLTITNSIDLNGAYRTIDAHKGRNLTTPAVGSLTGAVIGPGAGIVKTGGGTLQFSANNTYTGSTEIQDGILRLNNLTNSTSSITVTYGVLEGKTTNNGASSLSGTVTVANTVGAIIRPGTYGNNTMITGNLTFSGVNAGLHINMRFVNPSTVASKVQVNGNVDLGGCRLTISSSGIPGPGTFNIITCTGTMTGALPVIVSNTTGRANIVVQQVGTTLQLVVTL